MEHLEKNVSDLKSRVWFQSIAARIAMVLIAEHQRLRRENVMEQPESSVVCDLKLWSKFQQSCTVIRFKVKSSPSRCELHARDRSYGRRNRHGFSCRSKRKLDGSNNGQFLIICNYGPPILSYSPICLKLLISLSFFTNLPRYFKMCNIDQPNISFFCIISPCGIVLFCLCPICFYKHPYLP